MRAVGSLAALGMLDRIAQFIDENAGGNQAPSNYLDAPMIDPFSGAPPRLHYFISNHRHNTTQHITHNTFYSLRT